MRRLLHRSALVCGAILVLAGLLSFDPLWQALLPAGIYLGIHIVEGEIVTPSLLGVRSHETQVAVRCVFSRSAAVHAADDGTEPDDGPGRYGTLAR